MRLSGTLKEWIQYKPDAVLTHPKLQKGVEVTNFKFHKDGLHCKYPASYGNGPPMVPYFGSQAPYMTSGKASYTGHVVHSWYGCGVFSVLDAIAEDSYWYEVSE